jgi:hypothetical protein
MISTPDRFRPDTAETGPVERSCSKARRVPFDLDVLFEFGLARFLDGVGVLIA